MRQAGEFREYVCEKVIKGKFSGLRVSCVVDERPIAVRLLSHQASEVVARL
jgi:hypothetical protein